jgi:hypothetical protein
MIFSWQKATGFNSFALSHQPLAYIWILTVKFLDKFMTLQENGKKRGGDDGNQSVQ